jgi:hypothetical protein
MFLSSLTLSKLSIHHSPAPHFKTSNVFLLCCPKCARFVTIYSYAPFPQFHEEIKNNLVHSENSCCLTSQDLLFYKRLFEHTTVWTHHCLKTPLFEHTTVWTHHCLNTPLFEHTTVWTHHSLNTPLFEHTTVWTHHCLNTPLFEHTTVWTHHCLNTPLFIYRLFLVDLFSEYSTNTTGCSPLN